MAPGLILHRSEPSFNMTTSLQLLKFPLISAESGDISSYTIQLNFGDEVFFFFLNNVCVVPCILYD